MKTQTSFLTLRRMLIITFLAFVVCFAICALVRIGQCTSNHSINWSSKY